VHAAAAATTGQLDVTAATTTAAARGLLLLRLLLLVTGMHPREESQENQETNDLLHKLVDFPAVQQNERPIARKFSATRFSWIAAAFLN